MFLGLNDTLQILNATVSGSAPHSLAQFEQMLIEVTTQSLPVGLTEARVSLDRLAACAEEMVRELGDANPASSSEASEWAHALAAQCKRNLDELIGLTPQSLSSYGNGDAKEAATEGSSLRQLAIRGSSAAESQLILLERLAQQAGEMAQMEYGFLFNPAQRQLSIGYNVGRRRLDSSYYDLLASEARLCNFVAIAQGQLAQESWFALGRHADQR